MCHLRDDIASRAINHLKLRRPYEKGAQLYNAKINRENEGKNETSEDEKTILKVGRQVEKAKRCARCVKSNAIAGNEIRPKGPWTTAKEKKGEEGKGRGGEKRNNFGAMKKKPTASASGGVCGVGARPFSPLPDKHRFAYDRHFAGSII